jgi:hypothetical protein
MCRLCSKRKAAVRALRLEDKSLLAVCHAVSAGYSNMSRRADALQNASALFEALRSLHDKSDPKQFCSSTHLRTLQVAIKQVEGLDGISKKCTGHLNRLRSLLGMNKAKEVKDAKAQKAAGDNVGKGVGKRRREKGSVEAGAQDLGEEKQKKKLKKLKKQKGLTQAQE